MRKAPGPRLVLLVVLAISQARAEPVRSAAEEQFSAWLAAFNSKGRGKLAAYHAAAFPFSAAKVDEVSDLDHELVLAKNTDGFDVVKVEETSATRHVATLRTREAHHVVARATMDVDPAPPHHVVAFEIHALPPPEPPLAERDPFVAARLLMKRNDFAGAVLVAKNGKTVFLETAGLADRERKISNRATTKFRIGSMNKMFTAVATLQLVQAGKISLDAPLGKYLPDYSNKEVADKVTIHELLTHTAGTGDFFGPVFDAHRLELRTHADYVRLFGSRKPEFTPGTRWRYSNYGFLLLGNIIERVSGESYYDYVRRHIYEPAGMSATGSEPEERDVPGRSVGYMKDEKTGATVPNTETLPYRGTSAGGGYSTVGDLARFAHAIKQHKLIDAHYSELLTAGKMDIPTGRYAYGFQDNVVHGIHCFGHDGGAPGMNGQLSFCTAAGYVVVVLANEDPPAANRIEAAIVDRLPLAPP